LKGPQANFQTSGCIILFQQPVKPLLTVSL
jgi:hypothetical protein